EVRADPARRVRPHHRHVLPGRAPLPGRVGRPRRRLVGYPGLVLLPAQGDIHVLARDLDTLELREDPGGPDPRHIVETAPARHARPAHGHGGRGRLEGAAPWLGCSATGSSARASGPTSATLWWRSGARCGSRS